MLPSYLTQTVITIHRMVYDAEDRGTFEIIANDVPCYMRELTPEESATNGMMWGVGYFFMFKGDVDIDRGDTLTDPTLDERFGVEGVTYHPQGKTIDAFKQVLAKRSANE